MPYKEYNPNPLQRSVDDCSVRAICKATGKDWEDIYLSLCINGYLMCDMPSSKSVWNAYLRSAGFNRYVIPNDVHDEYTVKQFAEDHPIGTYILALSNHVVCVVDGCWYDTWDSGNEIPIFYWERMRK